MLPKTFNSSKFYDIRLLYTMLLFSERTRQTGKIMIRSTRKSFKRICSIKSADATHFLN